MKRRISRSAIFMVLAFSGLVFWSAEAAADSGQQLASDIESATKAREDKALLARADLS